MTFRPSDLSSDAGIEHETEEEKTAIDDEVDQGSPTCASYNFIRRLILRRRQLEIRNNGKDHFKVSDCDSLLNMLDDIKENGSFEAKNCLWPSDFPPRSIMIDGHISGELPTISGILDWDQAIFAPQFLGCTPPWWMWSSPEGKVDGFDEFDEKPAKDVPLDCDKAEIKRIFDFHVGRQFCDYAYGPVYRHLRTMYRLMQDVIRSCWGEAL